MWSQWGLRKTRFSKYKKQDTADICSNNGTGREHGDDYSRAWRGQALATYPKQGQSWVWIPSHPDRAHASLFAKQESRQGRRPSPRKGSSICCLTVSPRNPKHRHRNKLLQHIQPSKQVTPTLTDRNEAFVLQKGQPLNGVFLILSSSLILRVVWTCCVCRCACTCGHSRGGQRSTVDTLHLVF